jgi:hypothetical protein
MTAYSEKSFYDRAWDRHAEYVKRREKVDSRRDEIVEHIRPDLITGLLEELHDKEGMQLGDTIIEGTPPWCALVWSRGFQANMVGRKIQWARRRVEENPDPEVRRFVTFKGNDDVNKYQQALDETMSAVYRKSNFYDIINDYILDGGTVGSPVVIPEHDVLERRINCVTPHYSQCWWDRDYFGRDNALHVIHEMSALQALNFFGKSLPAKVQKSLDEGHQYVRYTFLQAIYPAGDAIFNDLKDPPRITRPWMNFYFFKGADENEKKPMETSRPGYRAVNSPFDIWHYSRKSNELYARTPGWWSLQDVKGLYAAAEANIEGLEQNVRPSMWSPQELEGLLDFGPAGENWAQDYEQYKAPPTPIYPRGVNTSDGMELMRHFIESCRRHYHVNLFMMLENLHAQQGKTFPTAYEIFKMEGERQSQLIPAIETFENGLLARIDSRFIEIEANADRLPEPPEILLEFGTGEVDIEFIGPLSTAQLRQQGIGRIHNALAAADPIMERWPDTKFKIKAAELLERVLEEADMYQGIIRSQEEYDEMIATKRQYAQQLMMAEQLGQAADAVPKLSKKPEEGSPLKLLTGAA